MEFEKLALPQLPGLMRIALKMTGNKSDAEDLVQETMLKAFKAFESFEWGTNFRAWLFRIMINTHYNDQRHRKFFKNIEESSYNHWIDKEIISQETMRAFNNPESSLCRRLVAEEINSAIEKLPLEYKTIFLLADVEGFSYKEISEIAACPIGTVMSRLHRARRMLQSILLGEDIFEKSQGNNLKGENVFIEEEAKIIHFEKEMKRVKT